MSAFATGSSLFARAKAAAGLLILVNLLQQASGQTADSFRVGANSTISALSVQPDGKIIAGGLFTTLGGQARNRIGSLNPDGSLDSLFNPGSSNSISALLVQPDGKIVAAGNLINFGFNNTNIVRFNSDGSRDAAFHPTANNAVDCLALQSDGKILVGGAFTSLAGQSRTYLGRLNPDGSLDTSFNPVIGGTIGFPYRAGVEVFSVAVQPDGKILVGGFFTMLNGASRTNIGRLDASGTVDLSFSVPPNGLYAQCLSLQSDGKILAGFAPPAALAVIVSTNSLRRYNADGTLDTTFNPGFILGSGATPQLSSLSVRTDGKILASGQFTRVNGQGRTNIVQLNADGTLDTNFNARIDFPLSQVAAAEFILAAQADGKILFGANLPRGIGGATNYVVRLVNTDPATQTLSFDGSVITWLREGASPEVWRTTFEACTNGADWVNLGDGARIAGGWQLGGLALPTNVTLRARGFLTGGADNGSAWFVESGFGPPITSIQP